ncbi:hypothetical protein E3N88_38256 [Mikania micrantha]|uniref:non-specific serine/threonine protein kinase n=1 Tax=Mikania micrantha TaxID=192012 RepID=A0A5N6LTK0_9ASTR|nr:hypothetical protein E3N88_38256 [Mikania micrantha]
MMGKLKELSLCAGVLVSLLTVSGALDSLAANQTLKDGRTIVSDYGAFELGFFSLNSSNGRYLGIWSNFISPRTYMWVSNAGNPINNTYGVLKLSHDGSPVAQILDTGNLVVRDDQENIIWQSNPSYDVCVRSRICGPYGTCNNNNSPMCSCLAGMNLPDTQSSWYNVNMTLEECRMTCIQNCSCTAYATRDIQSGCLLWFGDLQDMREYDGGRDLYVKMTTADLAGALDLGTRLRRNTGKPRRGSLGDSRRDFSLRPGNPIDLRYDDLEAELDLEWETCNKETESSVVVWDEGEDEEEYSSNHPPPRFHEPIYEDGPSVTMIWAEIFKESRLLSKSRQPWKSCVIEKQEAIVFSCSGAEFEHKVMAQMTEQSGDSADLSNESKNKKVIIVVVSTSVSFLVVCLILALYAWRKKKRSFTSRKGNPAQTLEEDYTNESQKEPAELPSFSLAKIANSTNNFSINNKLGQDEVKSLMLDWPCRFHIIHGIVRGLLYLHHDSRLRIIHRDLKAGNILLDRDMNPKISDFGLARRFRGQEDEANTNKVVGTLGYISPEYAANGHFSIKSDVFSFGVLLLEIVSGKKNRGFSHQDHNDNLLGHAWRLHKAGKSLELLAATLSDSCVDFEVLRTIHIGLLCVQDHVEDRPTMSSVVLMLGNDGPLPPPKQPAFFTETTRVELNTTPLMVSPLSIDRVTITLLEGR